MRDLARPQVIRTTALAALATAALCLPRLLMWPSRPYPIWYLEATVFTGSFVLWAFVFAWHTKYSGRPVFTLKIPPIDFVAVGLLGIATAALYRWLVDPVARRALPGDYPADLGQWLAMCLFSVALAQLFGTFAPYAWLMRLFQDRRMALIFTVLFNLAVLALRSRLSRTPLSPAFFAILLISRLIATVLSVAVYLRGGLLLAWWWELLVQLHFLPFS